jgi:CheY-like chemotaxis protein
MPEIDGFQAVKMMREIGVKSPIIALSADAFKTTIEKALTSGFDDYLTKPFTKEGLRTVLEKYAGNKEEK